MIIISIFTLGIPSAYYVLRGNGNAQTSNLKQPEAARLP